MTTPENQLARLQQEVTDLQRFRTACESLPVMVAELAQWKKDQNGFLRDLRDDVRALRSEMPDNEKDDMDYLKRRDHEQRGVEKFAKWAISIPAALVALDVILRLATGGRLG